jgi:hypothetical protein
MLFSAFNLGRCAEKSRSKVYQFGCGNQVRTNNLAKASDDYNIVIKKHACKINGRKFDRDELLTVIQ